MSLAIVGADVNADGVISATESHFYLQNIDPFVTSGDADSDGLMDLFDQDITSIDPVASVGTTPVISYDSTGKGDNNSESLSGN